MLSRCGQCRTHTALAAGAAPQRGWHGAGTCVHKLGVGALGSIPNFATDLLSDLGQAPFHVHLSFPAVGWGVVSLSLCDAGEGGGTQMSLLPSAPCSVLTHCPVRGALVQPGDQGPTVREVAQAQSLCLRPPPPWLKKAGQGGPGSLDCGYAGTCTSVRAPICSASSTGHSLPDTAGLWTNTGLPPVQISASILWLV